MASYYIIGEYSPNSVQQINESFMDIDTNSSFNRVWDGQGKTKGKVCLTATVAVASLNLTSFFFFWSTIERVVQRYSHSGNDDALPTLLRS